MLSSVKSYVICTTARSGSNLFCNFLLNTGMLGRPAEFLNPDVVRKSAFGRAHDFSNPVSVAAYIDDLAARTSRGEIFGIKILYEDFDAFKGIPAFTALLDRSVLLHLRRRSKLRQAISYLFAEETGQWVANDPARVKQEDVPYDFTRIDRHLHRLIDQDSRWAAILDALRQRNFHEIYLEDFLSKPSETIYQLIADLGLPSDLEVPIRPTLQEQKNPHASIFANRYRQELRDQLFGQESEKVSYKNTEFIP